MYITAQQYVFIGLHIGYWLYDKWGLYGWFHTVMAAMAAGWSLGLMEKILVDWGAVDLSILSYSTCIPTIGNGSPVGFIAYTHMLYYPLVTVTAAVLGKLMAILVCRPTIALKWSEETEEDSKRVMIKIYSMAAIVFMGHVLMLVLNFNVWSDMFVTLGVVIVWSVFAHLLFRYKNGITVLEEKLGQEYSSIDLGIFAWALALLLVWALCFLKLLGTMEEYVVGFISTGGILLSLASVWVARYLNKSMDTVSNRKNRNNNNKNNARDPERGGAPLGSKMSRKIKKKKKKPTNNGFDVPDDDSEEEDG